MPRTPWAACLAVIALGLLHSAAPGVSAQTGSPSPTVDVLVVYSQALLSHSTHESIAQQAAVQAGLVNDLFERSAVEVRVNVVGVYPVSFSSFPTMAQALYMANNPAPAQVITYREQTQADIVLLMTSGVQGCYRSLGMDGHDLRRANEGFVSVIAGTCGFAHAIGRSLGLGSFPGSSDAARPYAFGYVAFPPDGSGSPQTTFMSGDFGGTAAGRLSDPTVTAGGLALGDPLTADARRAVTEAAALVAAYRGCTHATSGPANVTVDPDGADLTFTVTTEPGCATGVPDALPSWLSVVTPTTLYQTGSATVTLRATKNLDFEVRRIVVTIGTRAVTITQQPSAGGACPTLELASSSVSVDGDADGVEIDYRAPLGCRVLRRVVVDTVWGPVVSWYDTGLRGHGEMWWSGRLSLEPNPLAIPRTEVVELSGRSLEVAQGPASCRLRLYSTRRLFAPHDGQVDTFRLDLPPLCNWAVTGLPSWVSIAGPSTGAGTHQSTMTVAANGGTPRLGTFLVTTADEAVAVEVYQDGSVCQPTFSSSASISLPYLAWSEATTVSFGTGGESCAWSISGLPSWLSASATSGQGTATVTFTAPDNTGSSRSADLLFGGVAFSVSQSASPCRYELSGIPSALPQAGGSFVVQVATRPECSWRPPPGVPSWIEVPVDSETTGSGSFLVDVPPNPGYNRVGTMGFVYGNELALSQAGPLGDSDTTGCATFYLSATELSAAPQTLRATVRQVPPCSWSVVTDAQWLSPLPPFPQAFDAEFDVGVSANLTPAVRTGTISIGGQTLTIRQAPGVGCSYIASHSVRLAFDGTGGLLRITTDPSCAWTVPSSTDPWFTVEGAGALRHGTGDVVVRSGVNTTDHARRMVMTFRGKDIDVVQEGNPSCTLTLTSSSLSLPMTGGRVTLDIDTPAQCTWRLDYGPPGATYVGPTSGTGPGLVVFDMPGHTQLLPAFHGLSVNGRYASVFLAAYVPYAPTRRYLAEGAVSGFFDTTIALFNPYFAAIDATLTFLRSGHPPLTTTVPLGARGRADVRPATLFGAGGAEFSTVIDTPAPIAIDRTMRWDATGYGSHTETAIVAPSSTWYLAEGATGGGFNLFYLLQNPSPDVAQVKVTYLRGGGLAPLEKFYSVPGESRQNIWVDVETFTSASGDVAMLADAEVSGVIEVLNDVPIIVERAMYLDRPGQVFGAGHNSAGVTAPATSWFLAEGATGPYFDMFVLLANPTADAAVVEVEYLRVGGAPLRKTYAVPPRSRFNIWVDQEQFDGLGAALADAAFSMTLTSTTGTPIIVERSMWWPGTSQTWHEAHNSPGATATGRRWAIASGDHHPASGRETYILVANTSDVPATIEARFTFANGMPGTTNLVVPAKSRANLPIPTFPLAHVGTDRFGVVIESMPDGQGLVADLVVELAQYRDVAGVRWQAGGNALATRLP